MLLVISSKVKLCMYQNITITNNKKLKESILALKFKTFLNLMEIHTYNLEHIRVNSNNIYTCVLFVKKIMNLRGLLLRFWISILGHLRLKYRFITNLALLSF